MLRQPPFSSESTTTTDQVMQLWILRILVPLGGHREFIKSNRFDHDKLAQSLGLGHWVDDYYENFDPKKILIELRKLYQNAEKKFTKIQPSTYLQNNIRKLSHLAGLNDTECRILEFVVLIHINSLLDDASDFLGTLPTNKILHALSVILNLPEPSIRTSLSSKGILAQSGLVTIDYADAGSFSRKLSLLSHDLADMMVSSDIDPIDLLRGIVTPVRPSHLNLGKYQHVGQSLDILCPYLKFAVSSNRCGVNILIHGLPGTGKSQLTRVLADELGCELFEVASEDSEGYPIKGKVRLKALSAAQNFFKQRKTLIVFDEAEDVFYDGDSFFGLNSTAQVRKAWINRMLENNQIPVLWLSNTIQRLDSAFVRRFDMVLELPIPPKKQREDLLRDICADLLDEQAISRVAAAENLAPAVITRAASVVRSIQQQLKLNNPTEAFEQLINNTLEAQGHKPLKHQDSNCWATNYDPLFVSANADLLEMTSGLIASGSGRLCLYGPPGTGKTAYSRWLADQLGKPLLVKHASDLLSKWVGENEQNVAKTFKEADQSGALLLIDEIDSFLQDRSAVSQSWKVDLVNEMLAGMEAFQGIFIATTNLLEHLDRAALRRFDLKIKFDYLSNQQALALLERCCSQLGLSKPSSKLKVAIEKMVVLTPGDFSTVMRRHRFSSIRTPAMFVSALEAECALKGDQMSSIGFV